MARLLLDTHALLWWLADDARLGRSARRAIADNETFASAVSGWEIAIKRALGKLQAPGDLEGHVEAEGFKPLPITFRHTERLDALPRLHDDPFDRLLVAQARTEGLVLVTNDARIRRYDVQTLGASLPRRDRER